MASGGEFTLGISLPQVNEVFFDRGQWLWRIGNADEIRQRFLFDDEDYAVAVELVLPHTLVFHLRV
ncbi:MAG TPA: hypothetical protein VGJ04_11040 [Pirellulales bacterium]